MEHERRRQPAEQTTHHRETRKKRRRTGSIIGRIFLVLFTLILVGICTTAMVAGIFMKYVETTLTPTLQVNADDYTMKLSSVIYYHDDEVTENDGWVEYQTIYGVEKLDSGKIFLDGKEVKIKNPRDAIKNGIGLLTEDRSNLGLILDWGIGRNITLTEIEKYGNKVFTNDKAERAAAKQLAEEVDTKAVSIFDKVSTLSGGNQQKVAVSKILASDLKVLIMDEPTKGIDVGAKAEIYDIMGQLAQRGYAIIMISSEMPEVLNMSDRIIVMCEGKITGELSREEATQEGILKYAMAKSLKNTAEN